MRLCIGTQIETIIFFVKLIAGCVTEYFKENGSEEDLKKKMQGYKCVLNSKAAEESMVECY